MVVKFPQTFIYEKEKDYKTKEIKIASTQRKKLLKWYFKTSEELDDEVYLISLINKVKFAYLKNYLPISSFLLFPEKKRI